MISFKREDIVEEIFDDRNKILNVFFSKRKINGQDELMMSAKISIFLPLVSFNF